MDALYRSLDGHPRVQGYSGDRTYNNPESLLGLTSLPHKCRHGGAIYMDAITQNHMISHRDVYSIPYHIFLIREPVASLAEIGTRYDWDSAASYYRLRLRRLLSVAKRTRRGVVLTHQDLEGGRGWDLIDSLLNLKPGLVPEVGETRTLPEAPYRDVVACQDAFERCLFGLRSLGLLSP